MTVRLPLIAALAVLLASLSLGSVLQGGGWFGAGIGAVLVVGAAGLATRMPGPRLAVTAVALVVVSVCPLLFWPAWPALVSGLVIVTLTAAGATGARTLRGFAILALYLAALLIYLNLLFAGGSSYGHLIPSHASLSQLGHMVRDAFDQFRYAPPVRDSRPVSLVGAVGIGLIAIMVDLLAVRMRRPAVAGLPLLVLFSVPVASDLKSFGMLQMVAFAGGMVGFLTLLSAASREHLRMWGPLVTLRYGQRTDESGTGPDTRELAASGRRIGLAAVCLAVVAPIVVPSLHPHDIFGSSGGPGSGSGAGPGGGVGSGGLDIMLQVQHDLRESSPKPVLTYTTTAAVPASQYFQLYVLNYSASQNAWLPQFSPAGQRADSAKLPFVPQGQDQSTPTVTVQTTVTMNKNLVPAGGDAFLPVPYAPVRLDVATLGGSWMELPGSLMLYNQSNLLDLGSLKYTVTSSEADPTPAGIDSALGSVPAAIQSQYGSYTGPDAARLTAIAHQHTAHAATPLQAALDLQDWLLSGRFKYSVNTNLSGPHWLLTFLTTGRRGYCQQFAWAFAVLARLSNIPSRIVVGYTGGSPGPGGTRRVTTADAHAWPELYFPGEGWLRFEPTPHGRTGQGTATVPAYATGSPGGGLAAPRPAGSAAANAAGNSGAAGLPGGLKRNPHNLLAGGGAIGPIPGSDSWLVIVVPVLGLVLLISPGVTRRLTRRRRWLLASGDAAVASAAWRELTDDLADYGISHPPGETPRALARRLTSEARLDQAAALALHRVVTAAERATYAIQPQPSAGLASDVTRVRRAVATTVPVRRRLRAWLLPVSTIASAQQALQRAGDLFNWLDTPWPGMRRRQAQPDQN